MGGNLDVLALHPSYCRGDDGVYLPMTRKLVALKERFPDIDFQPLTGRDLDVTLALARTNPRAAAEYAQGASRRAETIKRQSKESSLVN